MRTIVFFTQKGGSGKTTLTVHLAVAAKLAGERVAILDADPQGSASAWGSARLARNEPDPPVAGVTAADIHDATAAASQDGYSLLLIDAPPLADADARRILRAADAVLIPVRPSAFDLSALARTVALAQSAGKPLACVLNACPSRAPETREAFSVITASGVPVLASITERRAYSRAVAAGRAVMEFEPSGQAAAEIAQLWGALQ